MTAAMINKMVIIQLVKSYKEAEVRFREKSYVDT